MIKKENVDIKSIASQKDVKKAKKKKKNSTIAANEKTAFDHGEMISSKSVLAVTDVVENTVEELPDTSGESKVSKGKKKRRKKNKLAKQVVNKTTQQDSVECDENMDAADSDEDGLVNADEESDIDMSQWANLCVPDILLKALEKQRFETPSVIQTMALPSAIRDRRDILGAAETGSGKTLAFGIPVLAKILAVKEQKSAQRKESQEEDDGENEDEADEKEKEADSGQKMKSEESVQDNPPMALILEPTRELAVQVKKHLQTVAIFTDVKFATVVGGMSVEKQRRILAKQPEVIIATPGRLWQLIEEENDHLRNLDQVLCLVVDEADRMVEKGHYEELTKLLEFINKSQRRVKGRQTFVMSATLTMDPGAPKRLFNKKKKIHQDDKLKSLTERICVGLKPKVIDLTPKDKVAQTLTELRVNCKADEKDFYLYYFLCQHPGRTLVFVNSKDCLRRLNSLFSLLQCTPLPLHADMHQRQRLKNLDKFAENKRGFLIASDVAARGLDIPKVDHVIHYQVPRTMENYVHRSGRTARASNLGLSVMLVGPGEARDYRKIVQGVRNGEDLPVIPVEMDLMPAVKMRVGLARDIDVKEYRVKKKRMRNNFFTKAAEEMDMIIDDRHLLEDLGDTVDQEQDKQQLRQMKSQLTTALRGSLAPLRMTKYPTKSGKLQSKKTVDLHCSM
ncbi:ATP-dependent RNA helicase DDX24 isoform X2 [Aplysia californica]|nr:ATP-dependent RNA helicase DDX24 isoform X2 [Aplysia californica]